MRSPYHLRVVEIRNLTDEERMLTIEPSVDQHLGAATTFTGLLQPGEIKLLYLYHGFKYVFRILSERSHEEVTRGVFEVDRDLGLEFSGDSLVREARLVIDVGEPPTTFADSLQEYDPFGLRSGRPIEPDTASMREPSKIDPNERSRRGERNEIP